ncbi:MAG: riboflavin synthase subunit alpha [Pseudomonadales bacterium]
MYTGIVQGAFSVTQLERKPGLLSMAVKLPEHLLEELAIGASIGINGVCMTVTRIDGNEVWFDAMQQTLSLTTLGQLQQGDRVNIERSAKQGVEVGGHVISGHVDAIAEIIAVDDTENNRTVSYKVSSELLKYIFNKGFIGVHGCSLTVAELNKEQAVFKVCYIPETLRATVHGSLKLGDFVNIEVDRQTQAIVDTVERVLRDSPELLQNALASVKAI